ncbi:MAG: alkaline phosphatase family protein [Flavobacteriales bacterium]
MKHAPFPLSAALAIALVGTVGCSAQQPVPTWQDPPRLVVGIVVDQMRADMVQRYWSNYGEGGFRRLVREGAYLRNTHYNYAPTYTAPGHASIYTGTTPAYHGIVGNDLYDRRAGTEGYCATDAKVKGVGCGDELGSRSPFRLLATTLADELERRTERRSITVGISLKDRGAIMPIGRTGDAAYWFTGGVEGAFATSTWYRTDLPAWLQRFNAEGRAAKYLDRTWDLLLPRERYHEALPDDNPYEIPLSGAATATLPQDLAALHRTSGSTSILAYTPWGNTIITELALAAVEGEGMGADAVPDLLAISYSAPDILGHRVGPRALELEDMYVRLDRELDRLFKALDAQVGKDRYVVFLTADHAAADVPAYLQDLKGSAGYVPLSELLAGVEAALSARHGVGPWVRHVLNEQLWLNDSLIAARGLDARALQDHAAAALRERADIAFACSAYELMHTVMPSAPARALQLGFQEGRSGDVAFVMRPGYFERMGDGPGRGTTHGSIWNYDTHVPLFFMGRGIRQAEVFRRTHITDIAPTLSMLLGTALPDAAIGDPVPEVLR